MPAITPTQLFTDTLMMLGVIGASEVPASEDLDLCRRTFNRVVGQLNTRRSFASFIREQAFVFTTSQTTYSLGASTNTPTPDFIVSRGNAPNTIVSAWIGLTDVSPTVRIPMPVIHQDQWALITIPELSSTFPNTLYYVRPGGATLNGTLRPWPTSPTYTTYELILAWWDQLTQVAPSPATDLTTDMYLPDGFEDALVLTLAVRLYLSFPKRTDLMELKEQARLARANIQSVNTAPPKIDTTDGVEMNKASGWNWLTRLPG